MELKHHSALDIPTNAFFLIISGAKSKNNLSGSVVF